MKEITINKQIGNLKVKCLETRTKLILDRYVQVSFFGTLNHDENYINNLGTSQKTKN